MAAAAVAALAVVAYVIVFTLCQGNDCSFSYRLFEYIAPIVGGAFTLVGVAMTIRIQSRLQRESIDKNEQLQLRLHRLSIMPSIECAIEPFPVCRDQCQSVSHVVLDCDLDCASLTSIGVYRASIGLLGANEARSVSLSVFSDGKALCTQSIVMAERLTETRNVRRDCFELFVEDGAGIPDGLHAVLRFEDCQGNAYWRYCSIGVQKADDSDSAFGKALLHFHTESRVYYALDMTEDALRNRVLQSFEDERRAKAAEEDYCARVAKWEELVPNFAAVSTSAASVAAEASRGIPRNIALAFGESLSSGGYGGGMIASLKRAADGSRLYLEVAYGAEFFEAGNEFNRRTANWGVLLSVDPRNPEDVCLISARVAAVTPEVGFWKRMQICDGVRKSLPSRRPIHLFGWFLAKECG